MMSPARPSPLLGAAIASVLRGSWREVPEPPANLDQTLPTVAGTLLETGCGALGWWRVRGSALASEPGAVPLREAFRLHALQAAVHAKNLELAIGHFNGAGLTPIVFKGWAMARLYARPGLRPYGDVDLLVDTAYEGRARTLLANLPAELRGFVDLDMRVLNRFLPDRRFAELAERSSTETVGSACFRVLAAEDHLRLVCLHQLDHGGWRPLWLCDVAALVESLPKGFSWELCLTGNPRLSEAVVALVSLAEELLGAQLPPGTPRTPVPKWFRKAMLRAWAGGFQAPPDSLLELHHLGWRRATAAVRARWPDPVTSTLHLRAPLRGLPRLVLQVAECARRAVVFLRRWWSEGRSHSLSAADQGRPS
jgi:hypothetical protein